MDKAELLRGIGQERDVPVPGKDAMVRVRGLTRAEVLHAQGIADIAARERYIMARAMVDPRLSEADVGTWQSASPVGEMEPITRVVAELSGLDIDDGTAKELYKSAGD